MYRVEGRDASAIQATIVVTPTAAASIPSVTLEFDFFCITPTNGISPKRTTVTNDQKPLPR